MPASSFLLGFPPLAITRIMKFTGALLLALAMGVDAFSPSTRIMPKSVKLHATATAPAVEQTLAKVHCPMPRFRGMLRMHEGASACLALRSAQETLARQAFWCDLKWPCSLSTPRPCPPTGGQ